MERDLEKGEATLPGNEDIFLYLYVNFSRHFLAFDSWKLLFLYCNKSTTNRFNLFESSELDFVSSARERITFRSTEPSHWRNHGPLFLLRSRPELRRSIFPIGSIDQTFLITLRDEKSSPLFGIRIDRSSLLNVEKYEWRNLGVEIAGTFSKDLAFSDLLLDIH